MKRIQTFLLLTIALSALLHSSAEVFADDRADLEFFEKRIRPVLVGQCYSCHSQAAAKTKKLKGGLFLDSREGLLKGGDSGPAIEPGKPDDSLLLSAMRYDSFEMPPKGRLPKQVIADFAKWIKTLAPAVEGSADGYKRLFQAIEPKLDLLEAPARKSIDRLLLKLERSTVKKK